MSGCPFRESRLASRKWGPLDPEGPVQGEKWGCSLSASSARAPRAALLIAPTLAAMALSARFSAVQLQAARRPQSGRNAAAQPVACAQSLSSATALRGTALSSAFGERAGRGRRCNALGTFPFHALHSCSFFVALSGSLYCGHVKVLLTRSVSTPKRVGHAVQTLCDAPFAVDSIAML